MPTVTAEVTSISIVDVGGASTAAPRPSPGSVKGAVYRINPDGVWDQVWESREDSPYDVAFDRNGAVIIGTGGKGKVYRLEGDPLQPTLLARAAAQQVTAFYEDPRGRLYYVTANPGKLFRLGADRAARGTPTSRSRAMRRWSPPGARSAGGTATNGNRIEVSTRSGQHRHAGRHVERLVRSLHECRGLADPEPEGPVSSVAGRPDGEGDGPVLTSVTAAHACSAIFAAQVRAITVTPGIVFQKPSAAENRTWPDSKIRTRRTANLPWRPPSRRLQHAKPRSSRIPERTADAGLARRR